jgi:hypothetical protein
VVSVVIDHLCNKCMVCCSQEIVELYPSSSIRVHVMMLNKFHRTFTALDCISPFVVPIAFVASLCTCGVRRATHAAFLHARKPFLKMSVVWIGIDRRFWGAYCLCHLGDGAAFQTTVIFVPAAVKSRRSVSDFHWMKYVPLGPGLSLLHLHKLWHVARRFLTLWGMNLDPPPKPFASS